MNMARRKEFPQPEKRPPRLLVNLEVAVGKIEQQITLGKTFMTIEVATAEDFVNVDAKYRNWREYVAQSLTCASSSDINSITV